MRLSRRQFLAAGTVTGASLVLPWQLAVQRALAQVPGCTLDPRDVPKYQTPLVIPPAMPRTAKLKVPGGNKQIDYYEIAVRQFRQQILPQAMGLPTTVWSYGSVTSPATFNYPAFTIEAKWTAPVRVKWIHQPLDAHAHPL